MRKVWAKASVHFFSLKCIKLTRHQVALHLGLISEDHGWRIVVLQYHSLLIM